VQICLMVEGQEGVSWDEWVAMARAAETAGLHGLFRSDHYTSFHAGVDSALDAWATIAALGAVTERVRLGTLVSAATFRHPSELARVAVTADHVSGGRVEVGVGAGWFEQEHRQNGFPFPPISERFDMLGEYTEILVRSWTGESFDFAGKHFVLEGQRALPVPLQSPHPPLIVGGRGRKRSLALAARFADEYNAAFLSVEDSAGLASRLARACEEAGRDPASLRLSLMTLLAPGVDPPDAEARLERMSARFAVPRELCHAGPVPELAALLARYEGAGVARVYLQYPDRQDFAAIDLLGDLARVVGTGP
jgi:F420-dependent oxidoreductase-like protein